MKIILGPYHPQLEDALAEEIHARKEHDPLAPLLLVVPSETLRRRVKVLLAQERGLQPAELPRPHLLPGQPEPVPRDARSGGADTEGPDVHGGGPQARDPGRWTVRPDDGERRRLLGPVAKPAGPEGCHGGPRGRPGGVAGGTLPQHGPERAGRPLRVAPGSDAPLPGMAGPGPPGPRCGGGAARACLGPSRAV